jgi:ribosomal protein L37AE/L43A
MQMRLTLSDSAKMRMARSSQRFSTPIKFCPRCHGTEIVELAAGITGLWQCKSCEYIGSIFPEKSEEFFDDSQETDYY